MDQYFTLAFSLAFQAPLICLIICAFVFLTLGRNGLTRMQRFLVRTLAVCCVLLMGVELWSGFMNFGLIEMNPELLVWSLILAYTLMLLNSVLWCEFCISRCHAPSPILCSLIRITYFFVFVSITARIAFKDTKLYIYYENSTVSYGPLDDLQSYGCALLYLLVLIMILRKYCDRNEFAYKESNGKLIFATCIVLVSRVLYIVTWIPYLGWMGIMIVLLYIYMGFQSSIIYSDELTHLSNRRHMLRTIDVKIKDNSDWSYIIFDVNYFKQINDVYGHREGDRALEIIASVIKSVAAENEGAAFRYGGDEFVVLHDSNDEEKVRHICEEIDARFDAYNKEEKLPYLLSVSGGYAIYRENDTITIPDIMELADKRMYEDKKRKKAVRRN